MKGVYTCLAAAALLIAGVVYIEISVWKECRAEHSFFYCMNLVSR